ncbi:pyridoxal-phosphate-dependent aminotransferase family protein [Candidatus Hikarchaeum yamanae]|uniref:pyridoxal-phosphate-dependent aminotransferase family protein n=1 Tax=Candidatus Hikarchaeum yamanae TaxID=2675326 RepID=UPI0039ED4C33|tara:strand:- start:1646 stop:2830 length:1185 start_codon:yes stop_codon:yes gene_type:complete
MTKNLQIDDLNPPTRILMGPGPSNVHPRVLRAMSTPLVGHLDPYFLQIMEETQELLRYTFRTKNEYTIPVSGTGSAAMEAAFANVVEPGDTVLVPTNGYFGKRMESMAMRAGGEIVYVDAPWGEPLQVEEVSRAFEENSPDVFAFVHAETSTGALQHSVEELTSIAHENEAIVIADTVTSLGGVELEVDKWGIDVAYSGAQKCLSCPPGASPLTLNESALEKIEKRETLCRSWYLDLGLLNGYWGDDRTYHHTAPITSIYAIREALRLVNEEGIENRWERHLGLASALKSGVEAMGIEMNSKAEYWLPSLNAIRVPEGVNDINVVKILLQKYNLEIARGLGDLSGKIFRVGCMGHSANAHNISYFMMAFGSALQKEGATIDVKAGLEETYRKLE